MTFQVADRVRDTATTTGTGNFTVSGLAPNTYQTFAAVCANNDTFPYFIANQNANEWEVGIATYNTGNVIVRVAAEVLSGSAGAGVLVNFSAGTKDVVLGVPARNAYSPAGLSSGYGGLTTAQGTANFYYDGAGTVSIGAGNSLGLIAINQATASYAIDINPAAANAGPEARVRICDTTGSGAGFGGDLPTFEAVGLRGDGNANFFGRFAASFRRCDGTAIASGTTVGALVFGGQYGTDQTFQAAKLLYSASIQGIAEGSFTASNAMPIAIAFFTGSTGNDIQSINPFGTEAMRITSLGSVSIGTAAISTSATDGFLYIETCTGTPTGTPTSLTGRVPIVFDTTNSQFWIYTGGAWKQPKTPAAAATITWQ